MRFMPVKGAERQADNAVLPDMANDTMVFLIEPLHVLVRQSQPLNRRLLVSHRQDQASQRLTAIPSLGAISGTALATSAADPEQFCSGRVFSASLSLVHVWTTPEPQELLSSDGHRPLS